MSAFQENSHYEPTSPPGSIHGGRGAAGAGTANAGVVHSDNASLVDHVEKKGPVVVLTKRQKVKNHCGRFWLWYLIGTIIFLAILLPILFKVVLPAIVQDLVNKQSMPINGGAFLALSSTQLSVSLVTSLNTPLPATIDPLTLFLYNQNTTNFSPFLNLTLPEQHVNGDTPVIVTNQTVTITNETELIGWFNNVFDERSVKLSTRGDGSVRLGALQSNVHLDKTVDVPALNKLEGFGIQDLQLVLPADEKGHNVKGTVNLPNWSTLTIGLGNISLNLFSGDVRLGLVTVYDVVLPPGNNTRSFDGQIFLDSIVKNLGSILASQASALSLGQVQIDATGNSTIINGEHVRFVEAILNKKRLTSTMSVITLLGDVASSFLGGGTSESSLLDIFGKIVNNATFIEEVASHWNHTGSAVNATRADIATKMKRASPRGNMAWNMLKLGMKMKMAKA